MIPIDVIESTANELMAKAAIEIPDDYLTGLKKAADSEDGDLSSYVLRAMLDNYVAAKEDGRAMCGDTGTPRWYVKMGNETTIEGGPIALEAALRRATADATAKARRRAADTVRGERGSACIESAEVATSDEHKSVWRIGMIALRVDGLREESCTFPSQA